MVKRVAQVVATGHCRPERCDGAHHRRVARHRRQRGPLLQHRDDGARRTHRGAPPRRVRDEHLHPQRTRSVLLGRRAPRHRRGRARATSSTSRPTKSTSRRTPAPRSHSSCCFRATATARSSTTSRVTIPDIPASLISMRCWMRTASSASTEAAARTTPATPAPRSRASGAVTAHRSCSSACRSSATGSCGRPTTSPAARRRSRPRTSPLAPHIRTPAVGAARDGNGYALLMRGHHAAPLAGVGLRGARSI